MFVAGSETAYLVNMRVHIELCRMKVYTVYWYNTIEAISERKFQSNHLCVNFYEEFTIIYNFKACVCYRKHFQTCTLKFS